MAITFAQLQDLMKKEGYNFYLAQNEPTLRFWIRGLFGQYDILVPLQDDGRFLQFRTMNYLTCPPQHLNLPGVLKTLLTINSQKRLIKFAWNPAEGEIVAYADIWLMDNQLTQEQFSRMLGSFVPGIDVCYPRIKTALETGKDPGEQNPLVSAKPPPSGAPTPTPPPLTELLDKLKKDDKPPDTPPSKDKPEIKEI